MEDADALTEELVVEAEDEAAAPEHPVMDKQRAREHKNIDLRFIEQLPPLF